MATPDYTVNYNDERLTNITDAEAAAITENNTIYGTPNANGTYTGGMIGNVDSYYNAQIEAAQNYADQQTQIQNERTDFAIEQINQQKAQAKQDYTKEQSGAYVDWQKQSNQYGANAEQMAAGGMQKTGYSESSQVSMYNTYQNRVAIAREAYSRAVLNYNNAIKDAQLQNNAALAEIAFNALQKQLELSLEGFQYKNQLIQAKADKDLEIKQFYQNKWLAELNQINTENALAEEVRQYNESMAEEQRQYDATLALQQAQLEEEKRQYNATLAEQQRQFNATHSGNDGAVIRDNSGSGAQKPISGGTQSKPNNKATMSDFDDGVVGNTGYHGNNYNDAYDYAREHGVPADAAAGMYSKVEWKRDKKGCNTYAEYLTEYTSYLVSEFGR